MAERPVRVRFAPSPTGFFHVGSARTALYNHLHAVQHGGAFVLRIEDTDVERNRPEWVEGILDALRWIGVRWDEGPVFQSQRGPLYEEAVGKLFADGDAYYCGCTRADVESRTGDPNRGYDRYCRDRGLGPGPGRALRFRTPEAGSTTVVDLIRGAPTFENRLIEDFVLVRGNGQPVFLLANVVDDMEMGISHVIRGEEHLPNTPKALLLWEALGDGQAPVFAHVPVLVNEQRQKLSKRRDKVALEQYREEGYLVEAMRNYLMTLGWAPPGGSEIVPWETIVETFRIEDVNSAPAFFDLRKLAAFNGEYIRALTVDRFVDAAEPWLRTPPAPWAADAFDPAAFRAMAPHIQTRVTTLGEVPGWVDFLFVDHPVHDEASWQKAMKPPAVEVLTGAITAYERVPWDAGELRDALDAVGRPLGLKLAKAQAPVRVAVTGRTVGPPLFESLQVLGRARTLSRLRTALTRL